MTQELKEKRGGELNTAQQRIVDEQLRDFVLGGVALEVRLPADFAIMYSPRSVVCKFRSLQHVMALL